MAANPSLGVTDGGLLAPLPFPGELILLHRDCVELRVDGLAQCGVTGLTEAVTSRGRLFLSTVRLVFVPEVPAPPFCAFDLPLLYIRGERFLQPIFGANYLQGVCLSVVGGGVNAVSPPHAWSLTFKEGGCGTFVPLFLDTLAAARRAGEAPPGADVEMVDLRSSAYMDPNDPSQLFVSVQRAGQAEVQSPPPLLYPGNKKTE